VDRGHRRIASDADIEFAAMLVEVAAGAGTA
jgi:hypothetical protein